MLNFFIPCEPPRSTAQSQKRVGVKKNGTPFSYTTAKGKKQEEEFIKQLAPHVPEAPYEGSLRLRIIYRLPFLKAEKKEVRERQWAYHDRKPDCDNLVKMFQDAMGKAKFWNDDAQVVQLWITKLRHKLPGIHVVLEQETEDRDDES